MDFNQLISYNSEYVHKLNTQLNTKTKRKQLYYAFLKQREMKNTGYLGIARRFADSAKRNHF